MASKRDKKVQRHVFLTLRSVFNLHLSQLCLLKLFKHSGVEQAYAKNRN